MVSLTYRFALLAVLFVLPGALGVTFTEDFEDFTLVGLNPELDPEQDWYTFRRSGDIGNVSATSDIEGAQAFILEGASGLSVADSKAAFNLVSPNQLETLTFFVEADSITDLVEGSQQVIRLYSSGPRRLIVEFYVLCTDSALPDGCALNVRFDAVDTRGQELVPASLNQTQFKVHLVFDWRAGEYDLFVDDVDDGTFSFLELPRNFAGLELQKVRSDYPVALTFDNWTITGALQPSDSAVDADVAEGLQNFAVQAGFESDTSRFLLGLIVLILLVASVAAGMKALGGSARLAPSLIIFTVGGVLWLTLIDFWPSWVDLTLIIFTSAILAGAVRQFALGMRDASTSSGAIMGAIGYFLTASSLLALSGFAVQTVEVPNGAPDEDGAANQSFGVAVVECLFTVFNDCSQKTETRAFAIISDIIGWARAAVDFLFQLLTFQLPIPVLFNAIIVLPPAAVLAVEGFKIVRG